MKKLCIYALIILLFSSGLGMIMHSQDSEQNNIGSLLEIIGPGVAYADTLDFYKPPPPPPID